MTNGTKVIIEQFGAGYAVEIVIPPRDGYSSYVIRSVHDDLRKAIYAFVYNFGMFPYQIVSSAEQIERDKAIRSEHGN